MEPSPATLHTLRHAYPFQDVTDEVLSPLVAQMQEQTLRPGQLLWRPGDAADHMWFVLHGQVHTVYTSAEGTEVVTEVMGAGDGFGQPALFAQPPVRVVSVVAIAPSRLARLHRDPLLRFLEENPAALRRMLESMSRLILAQSQLFGHMAFHDVRGRVAYHLLKLAEEYGSPVDGGVRIPFRLTQTAWAGMVAASRESTNRALSSLIGAGHIRRDAGYIVVADPAGLRRALAAPR